MNINPAMDICMPAIEVQALHAAVAQLHAQNRIMRATLWEIATSDPISSVNLIEKARTTLAELNGQ